MSIFPVDYTSPIGQVRNLTNDTIQYDDPADYLFSDARIESFLALNKDNVRLAAADVLDAIADNEILVAKKIRTEDLQTDGPAVGKELRAHADSLRAQAREEAANADAEWGIEIVPTVYTQDQIPCGFPRWF